MTSDGAKLVAAVSAVDWQANIDSFAGSSDCKDRVAAANKRIAQWAKQLETVDKGNAALTFVRELQVQGHYAAALISLALYKPAASAMRAMLETALCYTYFRTHPVEMQTLVRDADFFVDKRTVVEFHRKHSVGFGKKQQAVGFISRLEKWYSTISAIVHGQVPGKWTTHTQLQGIAHNPRVCDEAIQALMDGEDVVHRLMLCTIAPEMWYGFTPSAKKELLKGFPATTRAALGLALT